MSEEPRSNAQRADQHQQPRESASQPPPQPRPNPPQPPQPPPPPPPQPNPPRQSAHDHEVSPPEAPPVAPPRGGRSEHPSTPDPPDEQHTGPAPHIAALLAYLFGWISGLIVYLTQKDHEVRFHAAQSILTFGGLAVLILILGILNIGGSVIVTVLILLLYTLSFGLWVFLSIQGYQFRHTKLPMIGDIAERWATK